MIPGPVFHPAARRELSEAAEFYDLERLGLGTELLDAIESAILTTVQHPEAWPVVLGEVRKQTIARFPYSIMYSVRDGSIYVSAIAHQSRRPFYWSDRA